MFEVRRYSQSQQKQVGWVWCVFPDRSRSFNILVLCKKLVLIFFFFFFFFFLNQNGGFGGFPPNKNKYLFYFFARDLF